MAVRLMEKVQESQDKTILQPIGPGTLPVDPMLAPPPQQEDSGNRPRPCKISESSVPSPNKNSPVQKSTPALWAWWMPILSAVASLGGSLTLGLNLRSAEPWGQPATWIGGIVALLGIVGSVSIQVEARRRNKRGSQDVVKFNDALSDLHDTLADLLRSERDDEARKVFFKTVVRLCPNLFAMSGVRVCIYELEAGESEESDEIYLRLITSAGRRDQPRREFRGDTEHGRAAIAAAQRNEPICVHDPARTDHPVQRDEKAIWKSFFLTPLRDESRHRGILTVDTRETTNFTYEDLAIAETVARLIVLGMTELVGAARETQPEVEQAMTRIKAAERPQNLSSASRAEGQSADKLENEEGR